MQVVYHIGANCTDGDRLLRSLLRNVDGLRPLGTGVPGPGRYRKVLREAILGLVEAGPRAAIAPQMRDTLVEEITDGQDLRRLVMSNSTFLCLPQRVFDGGRFFGMAAAKAEALARLFPTDEIEIFVSLRNPATFVPAVWRQSGMDFDAFSNGIDPRAIRWSDVVASLRAAAPSARLVVWCNEDTTLIWGSLLRLLAGVGPDTAMAGDHDLLAAVMAPEGMSRFLAYMATHPGQNDLQVRRVIGAFLDKYALPEALEEEVDVPGWDARLVDEITRAYEADTARIMAMEGVEFVTA